MVLEKLLFTEFETSESSVSNADPWTSNLPPISSVRWDGSSYVLRPLLTFVKAYGKQQRLFSASTYLIYTLFSSDGNIRISFSVTHSSCHMFLPDIWFFFHLGLLVTWFSCHLWVFFVFWVFLWFGFSCDLGLLVTWAFLSFESFCHWSLLVIWVLLCRSPFLLGFLLFRFFVS